MAPSSISVVLPEPTASKTEDINQIVSSGSLTNGLQTVTPVDVRSAVPVTEIVKVVSNISLSPISLHSKVYNLKYNVHCLN